MKINTKVTDGQRLDPPEEVIFLLLTSQADGELGHPVSHHLAPAVLLLVVGVEQQHGVEVAVPHVSHYRPRESVPRDLRLRLRHDPRQRGHGHTHVRGHGPGHVTRDIDGVHVTLTVYT